jgi:hypothetical protein
MPSGVNKFKKKIFFFSIVKCDNLSGSKFSRSSFFDFLYINELFVDCLLINYDNISVIANSEISVSIFIGLFGLKLINIDARVKNAFSNLNATLTISLNLKGFIFLPLTFLLNIEVNDAAIRE